MVVIVMTAAGMVLSVVLMALFFIHWFAVL
jgi:hypothetical protein